ncbi:hypothetical protein D3C73_690770 [compost metagenome]
MLNNVLLYNVMVVVTSACADTFLSKLALVVLSVGSSKLSTLTSTVVGMPLLAIVIVAAPTFLASISPFAVTVATVISPLV